MPFWFVPSMSRQPSLVFSKGGRLWSSLLMRKSVGVRSLSTTPGWKTEVDDDDEKPSRFWKKNNMGRYQRPIFVAATKQHVGKTTVSLALMSGLKKRFDKVGFIKPVGQQHVEVMSDNLGKKLSKFTG